MILQLVGKWSFQIIPCGQCSLWAEGYKKDKIEKSVNTGMLATYLPPGKTLISHCYHTKPCGHGDGDLSNLDKQNEEDNRLMCLISINVFFTKGFCSLVKTESRNKINQPLPNKSKKQNFSISKSCKKITYNYNLMTLLLLLIV